MFLCHYVLNSRLLFLWLLCLNYYNTIAACQRPVGPLLSNKCMYVCIPCGSLKKRPQFSALEKTHVVSLGKIGNWIEHCQHYSITPMASFRTLLRNTGWRRHTPKINLSKSDISPERLYHSRCRFSKKLTVSVGVSWNGKNWCLFHWFAENKSWPELLHWSVEDFLTTWMSSTLSGQWLWIPARQCTVTPCKSNAKVSTTK